MTTYGVSRGHRPQGDRRAGRRRPAPQDPRQGHLRGPAAAGEPAAPGVVQPGHASPRAHAVDTAARHRAGAAAGRRRRGARASALRRGLADRAGPARRRPADRARAGLVPARPRCPASTSEDLGGSLYELFAVRYGHTIDAAEQTLWGETADGSPRPAARPPRCTPRCWSSAASRRRPAPRWSTSSRATAATATSSTCRWVVTDTTRSPVRPEGSAAERTAIVTTQDAGAETRRQEALQPRAGAEVRHAA